jgi:hypothetical protein
MVGARVGVGVGDGVMDGKGVKVGGGVAVSPGVLEADAAGESVMVAVGPSVGEWLTSAMIAGVSGDWRQAASRQKQKGTNSSQHFIRLDEGIE